MRSESMAEIKSEWEAGLHRISQQLIDLCMQWLDLSPDLPMLELPTCPKTSPISRRFHCAIIVWCSYWAASSASV